MLNRISAVVLLAGALIAAGLTIAPEGESSQPPTADCRAFTPTPTASPTPWPTPPWIPTASGFLCNNTSHVASDLHIMLPREAVNTDTSGATRPIWPNPSGCPEPTYEFSGGTSPAYVKLDIDWGVACVEPGEYVNYYFVANCTTPEPACWPPHVTCYNWTADGSPIPSSTVAIYQPQPCTVTTSTGSPTPTPGPCPARPTPPYPEPPTHPPTPVTVGPTSRDVVLLESIPFCNNSGVGASDLHIYMAHPYTSVVLHTNAPGCPLPLLTLDPQPWDKLVLDVDWEDPCVDDNESVILSFYYGCGDSPCIYPSVYCYTWTLNDVFVDSEGDCPQPTDTPTPTPPGGPICPGPTRPPGGTCPPCPGFGSDGVIPLSTCPPPPPTPVPPMWGDLLCDSTVLPDDTVSLLRLVAGLDPLPQPAVAGCPEPGDTVVVNEEDETWGDWNCDGNITASDVMPLLMTLAGIPVLAVIGPCPHIGSAVTVDPEP